MRVKFVQKCLHECVWLVSHSAEHVCPRLEFVPNSAVWLYRFTGRWHGHMYVWGLGCRHYIRDDDTREGEVIPRQARIIHIKVGWTFTETWGWNKAER